MSDDLYDMLKARAERPLLSDQVIFQTMYNRIRVLEEHTARDYDRLQLVEDRLTALERGVDDVTE